MVGCEEGLLPLEPRTILLPDAENEHVKEERRLFFVGMTRAAKVLYLTGAEERHGFEGKDKCTPSRFLAEIPEGLLGSSPQFHKKRRKNRTAKQLRLF